MTGKEIHERRKALGLTQEQLAEQVGVNRTAVTLWECGNRNPSGAAQKLLRQILGDDPRNPPRKIRRAS